jgi:hypothetical protein
MIQVTVKYGGKERQVSLRPRRSTVKDALVAANRQPGSLSISKPFNTHVIQVEGDTVGKGDIDSYCLSNGESIFVM